MPGVDAGILCSNLSKGLHAAAQPLAILRASLGTQEIERMSRDELQELATSSAMHVERVCILYSCIEQLVTTEIVEPQLTPTPIVPLILDVMDRVRCIFEDNGMSLNLQVSDTSQPVLIHTGRTMEALSIVLLIAYAVSSAPDGIELIVSRTPANKVRVVVQNQNSQVDVLEAEASLRMDIADADIRSQRASFSWSLHPFVVQIDLPKAPPSYRCL